MEYKRLGDYIREVKVRYRELKVTNLWVLRLTRHSFRRWQMLSAQTYLIIKLFGKSYLHAV